MPRVNKGVLYLSSGALCYSLGSLSFSKSGAQSSQINTWVGLIAIPVCILILSLNTHFSPFSRRRSPDLYLSILNGFLFGGAAIYLHFWSLEYLLPSDNNMVVVAFFICSSVVFQIIEEKRMPSILTFASVLLGILGTFFVCNPTDLFTKNILELDNIKGVCLVALAGISFGFLYSSVRRYNSVPPVWICLGAAFGNLASGLTSYNPWSDASMQSCDPFPRILALMASVFQSTTLCSNLTGVMETGVTVTAAAVIQLLSPVFSFLLQLVLFPHIVWWRSGVGILSIILAVMVQLRVLKKREKEIAKSQVIRSCLTEDIQLV